MSWGNDERGLIEIAFKPYAVTTHCAHVLTIEIQSARKVQGICDTIIRKGRDKYNFTDDDEGCRYWVSVVLSDLADEGVIALESRDQALEDLALYWRDPRGRSGSDLDMANRHSDSSSIIPPAS